MAKRGRPSKPPKMRGRAAFTTLFNISEMLKRDLEDSWKDYRRNEGRITGEKSRQRAQADFIDAATIAEILKRLVSVGLAQLDERTLDVVTAIDVIRGEIVEREQERLEAGEYNWLYEWAPKVSRR